MKVNCINPPCRYSYFYQIVNPKKDTTIIPFYFALGNSLSVSSFTQVIFPWSYTTLNVMGCVEDIYGTTNCKLIQHTITSSTSNLIELSNICNFVQDIASHLILLKNVDDQLSLAQFMTAVLFEIIDGEYNDGECIEAITDLIMEYVDSCVN